MANKRISGLVPPTDGADLQLGDQVVGLRAGVTRKMTFGGKHVLPDYSAGDIGKALRVTGANTHDWVSDPASVNSSTTIFSTITLLPNFGFGFARTLTYIAPNVLSDFDDVSIQYTYPLVDPADETQSVNVTNVVSAPVSVVTNGRIMLPGNTVDIEAQVREAECVIAAYKRVPSAATTGIPTVTHIIGLTRAR